MVPFGPGFRRGIEFEQQSGGDLRRRSRVIKSFVSKQYLPHPREVIYFLVGRLAGFDSIPAPVCERIPVSRGVPLDIITKIFDGRLDALLNVEVVHVF